MMLLMAVLSLSPRAARADDDEASKLAARGAAARYTLKTTAPPSPIDMGGASILVNAPLATVRKIVTAYGSYQTFLSPFDQSRVLAKRKGVSEVYLQVPILNGAVHIWAVADLSPPKKNGAGEEITARFKRGNVDDFRANWHLRAIDEGRTVLKLELLVAPKLPFPSSIVTAQLVNAAEKAVTAVRDRAQAQVAKPNAVAMTGAAAPAPGPSAAADGGAPQEPAPQGEGLPRMAPSLPTSVGDETRRQGDVARR
jgi:ribosome-associated toxin RatA of RatAB toxin-antitoxin module